MIEKEAAANIAEITIIEIPAKRQFEAEEVEELLSQQRQIIAERIRK